MLGNVYIPRGQDRVGETNSASIYVYLQAHFASALSTQESSFSAGLMQSMNDLRAEN